MAGFEKKKPPVNMDLLGFRFPITAIVSIFHRVSGAILFLAIPLFIYLFHLSLRDEVGFVTVVTLLQIPWMRFLSVILLWSFIHHFFAGLRFLLLDLDLGMEKQISRVTSWVVILTAFILVCVYVLVLL